VVQRGDVGACRAETVASVADDFVLVVHAFDSAVADAFIAMPSSWRRSIQAKSRMGLSREWV